MPRKWGPKSLKELCSNNVVDNMNKWHHHYINTNDEKNFEQLVDVEGPFDCLRK